jgi:uncharacterized repeat protein (TIGR01451 family)
LKKSFAILSILVLVIGTFAALNFAHAHPSTGGPDSFGYTYIDSNDINGPTYNWIDITQTGTQILFGTDDSYVANVPLGFFFNYYGTDYSQITIGNNGLLFSTFGSSQYVNQPITQTPNLHGFLAPYWDDLVTWTSGAAIYYQTIGTAPNRIFVAEWYNNGHYHTSSSGVTFEALLYEGSNSIIFQYNDLDFGTVSGSTSSDLGPYNNGGSATVGIEDPMGTVGLQYSYNEQVINPGLAILFKFPVFSGANLYLSMNGPASMDQGHLATYTIFYNNYGSVPAANVELQATLPAGVEFQSASDGGVLAGSTVTWNLGSVPAFPNGHGSVTVTVRIPDTTPVGTVLTTSAAISSTTIETRLDDNEFSVQTAVTGSSLPPNVDVGPLTGNTGPTPTVYWGTPITFTYVDAAAVSVDIAIHVNDGGADITGSMTGPAPTWTYTTTFYPRHGQATVTYTPHYPSGTTNTVQFGMYIDPAGYVYDVTTNNRIQGATVWLQWYNAVAGEWENVPTGQTPEIMQPDVNPQITDINGQYQWDTLAGSYRVHVEAPGYYPADSIVVTVPPPVFDLNVGLTPLPVTYAASASVWTTNDAGVELSEFGLGQTVYIHWHPSPDNTVVDIQVQDQDGNVVFGPALTLAQADSPVSFTPPFAGYFTVLVNGAPAFHIAVSTLFVVPESALGTLMATIACLAAAVTLHSNKHKHKKP